jgi:hypothetical protein
MMYRHRMKLQSGGSVEQQAETKQRGKLEQESEFVFDPKRQRLIRQDVSAMGYRDDSPYRDKPSNLIETPTGRITMSGVSQPLIAVDETGDRRVMQPGEEHQFKGKRVLEMPCRTCKKHFQYGGEVNAQNSQQLLQGAGSLLGGQAGGIAGLAGKAVQYGDTFANWDAEGVTGQQKGQAVGGTVGGTVGAIFGGTQGAALGAQLGETGGAFAGGLFGNNASVKAPELYSMQNLVGLRRGGKIKHKFRYG